MVKNIDIFLEGQNQRYVIDPELKYVFYFQGCFSPPHAGHFQNATSYIDYPNVKIIIHQIGSEKRHGIPSDINRKIWKIYIAKCMPRHRVDLIQYTSSNKMSDVISTHPWISTADVCLISRGNDFTYLSDFRNRLSSKFQQFSNILPHLKFVLLISSRDSTVLSATTFIQHIIKYKNKYIPITDLYHFLPSSLPTKYKLWIIHQCSQYYLH